MKNYVLGPLYRRFFGGGGGGNNNNNNADAAATAAGRDVPQNVMRNNTVYGLQVFDRAEVNAASSSKSAKTFLVAVATKNNNEDVTTSKSSSSVPLKNDITAISKNMNSEVLLRGCSRKNTGNVSYFDDIIKKCESSSLFESPENVVFVAVRVAKSGTVKGAVMTKDRSGLKSFIERVLDGTETMTKMWKIKKKEIKKLLYYFI